MSGKARNHHFLSQCYLKRFTEKGTKDSHLIGFNLYEGYHFSTIPRNVGAERDFNQIDVDALPSNYLESELAKFEALVDMALNEIESTGRFEGKNKSTTLLLIALFSVRNPARRLSWDKTVDQMAKVVLSCVENTPIGAKINGKPVTQELKNAIQKIDKLEFKMPRNQHINSEFLGIQEIIPLLFARKWILIRAPGDTPFITSDRPVVLLWNEVKQGEILPGFNHTHTQIYFTLSKKFALLGVFDGEDGAVLNASGRIVAGINSNILQFARSFVYAPQHDFSYMKENGEICYGLEGFGRK